MNPRPFDYITPKNLTDEEIQAYKDEGWELFDTTQQVGALYYCFKREMSEERYEALLRPEA